MTIKLKTGFAQYIEEHDYWEITSNNTRNPEHETTECGYGYDNLLYKLENDYEIRNG